jgi:hypothetical protein
MAYLKDLDQQCRASGCTRRAVVAVYNRVNACLGEYCRACGKSALRKQEQSEASSS